MAASRSAIRFASPAGWAAAGRASIKADAKMIPMQSVRGLVAAIWLVGGISAFLYAQYKQIPAPVAVPIAAAFLVELSLYANMVHAAAWRPWVLWGSALAPYLIYALGLGQFRLESFALLAALAAVAVWWLRLLPEYSAVDLLFLAFMAAVYLLKLFRHCYPDPYDLDVDTLGKLMWIRVGIASVLRRYPANAAGFGFLPKKAEWQVGLRHFLWFAPLGLALGVAIGIGRFSLVPGFWYKAVLAFIGSLWVVALMEEFFFRGLLQKRLTIWLGIWPGLLLTSAIFGLAHLWFADRFPNWKQVAVAGVLGVFCGRAFLQANAVRASMVTHALAVATWRALFER